MSLITCLPVEILFTISDFLPPKDIINLYSSSATLSRLSVAAANRLLLRDTSCVNLIIADFSPPFTPTIFLRVSFGDHRESCWKISAIGSLKSLIGGITQSPFVTPVLEKLLTIHIENSFLSTGLIADLESTLGNLLSSQLFYYNKCNIVHTCYPQLQDITEWFPFHQVFFSFNNRMHFGPLVKVNPTPNPPYSSKHLLGRKSWEIYFTLNPHFSLFKPRNLDDHTLSTICRKIIDIMSCTSA